MAENFRRCRCRAYYLHLGDCMMISMTRQLVLLTERGSWHHLTAIKALSHLGFIPHNPILLTCASLSNHPPQLPFSSCPLSWQPCHRLATL